MRAMAPANRYCQHMWNSVEGGIGTNADRRMLTAYESQGVVVADSVPKPCKPCRCPFAVRVHSVLHLWRQTSTVKGAGTSMQYQHCDRN